MAKQLESISSKLKSFIEGQHVFFVGTAAPSGRVNVSPKGMDSLRVINENKVVWLNLTGSGNETAAHLLQSDRMTIMFCSFEKNPMILRLYGHAKIYHEQDDEYIELIKLFPNNVGARQIIALYVDLVQTSCGYAVPFMDFREERTTLATWADKKGREGIASYWEEKNLKSIDGYETGMTEK